MVHIENILNAMRLELSRRDGYQIKTIENVRGNYMINCPYHGNGNERNPSFGILKQDKRTSKGSIKAGHGNCFACGASVNIEKLVADVLFGGRYEESKVWLLDNFGIDGSDQITYESSLYIPTEEKIIPYKEFIQYHPYMEKRGISLQTATFFELGYDIATSSMVIPVHDVHGVCRMTIRRNVDPNCDPRFRFRNTAGTNKDTLLHGLDKIYYNIGKYTTIDTVVVVESSIDMMLLWQQGYLAVATMQAIPTESQLEQLRKLPFPKLLIATDNDKAGEEGYERYKQNIKTKTIQRLAFPRGVKDIGEFSPQDFIGGLKIREENSYRDVSMDTRITTLKVL